MTSQSMMSTTMSSVSTSPYIAPAKASSTAENVARPSVLPAKYQRQ